MKKQRFAFVAAVMLLSVILLATPAGKVLADALMQFFTRAQGNTLPVPTDQIAPPAPTRTPAPTHALALHPAGEIVTPTPTITPTLHSQAGVMQDMTLLEAEAAIGFDLYEPLELPRDYRLIRIQYDSQQQAVTLLYASPKAATGEFFSITQGKHLPPFEVGADAAVETISIGATSAEFVRGMWFTPAGSDQAYWEDRSEIYTLRWQMEDVTIDIQFVLNESFSPAYLERDEMLAVARSLRQCKTGEACPVKNAATPTPGMGWEQAFTDVAGLETATGYDVLEPAVLPEGLSFSHARFEPSSRSVMLFYGSFGADLIRSNGPVLIVYQRPLTGEVTPNAAASDTGYPAEAIQIVEVNGYPGTIYRGSLSTGLYVEGQPTSTPAWTDEYGEISLDWTTEDWMFSLRFSGSSGARLTQEDLIAIAESLR
ncbi:hypothetical protein [Longilinea arvoryzae]|nr:hypothetical protein [Longilinea arvoryzae]